MLKNEVKMVVCDLDGTLLKHSGLITEHTKEVISQLKQQGIIFGICSGRPSDALRHLIGHWGIEKDVDFVLGFNGGVYFEPGKPAEISGSFLDGGQMKKIRQLFAGSHLTFAQYQGKKIVAENPGFLARAMASRNKLEIQEARPGMLDTDNPKMMAIGMPWNISRFLKTHPDRVQEGFRFFQSGPFLIEVVSDKLSKLEGVRYACEKFGIAPENVLSFGNDNNDLEMLAGTMGVAMANALPSVKEAASYQAGHHAKDGVARFLEENVLNSRK